MGRPPQSVTLVEQTPAGSNRLYKRVVELLKTSGLERFRAAVAYARWDGIGLIAPQIEEFLESGGEFQSIYGVANGVTTPDSLLYGLYLQDEWRILPRLTVNYGARFDVVDEYDHENQISPRINVVWKPTDSTTLHAGYSRYSRRRSSSSSPEIPSRSSIKPRPLHPSRRIPR